MSLKDIIEVMSGEKDTVEQMQKASSRQVEDYWKYIQKVNGSVASSEGNSSYTTSGGSYSFGTVCGSGGVKLLSGNRNEAVNALINAGIASGWAGYVKLDTNIFRIVSDFPGSNNFHPDFAKYFTFWATEFLMKTLGWSNVTINSGFRSIQWNDHLLATMGSTYVKSDSYHQSHCAGISADIACNNDSLRWRIADEAFAYGFGGIAISTAGFVHVDIGPQTYWQYTKGEKMYLPPGRR